MIAVFVPSSRSHLQAMLATAMSQEMSGWCLRAAATCWCSWDGKGIEVASSSAFARIASSALFVRARIRTRRACCSSTSFSRHNFADTMLRQLALEEPDKHITGHGVEFDTAVSKEVDLRHACAVSRQRGGTRRPVSRCLDGLRIQPQCLDVGEPQSEVDNAHVIMETIAGPSEPSVPKMLKPDTSKSCATSTLSMRGARRSSSRRAAVVDMPLVDMMAMSNRSAIRAWAYTALNPSFSTNRTAEYLFSGPVVGLGVGRSPSYWRTSTVPSGTLRAVCGSMKLPRSSNTTSHVDVALGMLLDVVGEERLSEVAIVGLRPAGQLENALSCLVHNLMCISRKAAIPARRVIGVGHYLSRSILHAHAAGRSPHRTVCRTARLAQRRGDCLAVRRQGRFLAVRSPRADRLCRLGYTNVTVHVGDGYFGWREVAPFDGIICHCSAAHIPPLTSTTEAGSSNGDSGGAAIRSAAPHGG